MTDFCGCVQSHTRLGMELGRLSASCAPAQPTAAKLPTAAAQAPMNVPFTAKLNAADRERAEHHLCHQHIAGQNGTFDLACRLHPLTGAHQSDGGAIGGNAVDVDIRRANHPINVDQAAVCTLGVQFRWR